MPAARVSMRRVREILRLKHECGATDRAIARSLGIARSTVAVTLDRLAAAELGWPLPATLSDRVLEAMLYAGPGTQCGSRRKAEPDWTHVHRELRRPGVTLMLLWEEYRQAAPDGYGYSRWCELYRGWEGRLSPTMRQSHPAGERMFVDYAGQTVELCDGRSGEIRAAQIFVAVMGASSYTYAEASWTQTLPDWIGSHVRALAFMGGAPAQLVPDNPKVGVTRANWYEPGLNRTYLDLATHYRTAILPARPRKPRDKAKVEVGVLVVERWILARLRNRRFFSLSELNQAIAELVADLKARPMRRLGVSRRDLFLELDKPALKSLPAEPYEYAEWRLRRVGLDYHVDIDGHYYSVPADPRAARCPHHRPHGRAVPQRRAGCRASTRRGSQPAYDHRRAHAQFPSALRRMDHRADRPRGGGDRAKHCQAHRADPREPASSRAGLPRLHRHPAPGPPIRCRTAGSGLRSWSRHRRPVLRIDPVDPQAWARQAAGPTCPAERAVARPPQHPRLPLLPLRRLDRADPSDH